MDTTTSLKGKELYDALNVRKTGTDPIPGLKEKIHFGLAAFASSGLYLSENPLRPSRHTHIYYELDFYDNLIKCGAYALAAVKSKLQSYDDLTGIKNYYEPENVGLKTLDHSDFLKFLNKHSNKMIVFGTEPKDDVETRPAHVWDWKIAIKENKAKTLTVVNALGNPIEMDTVYLGLSLVYCLAINGAYVNAGHHMTSINSILKFVTKFGTSKKDAWFQDGGINLEKLVKKTERGDLNKFRTFASLGISRKYHPHLRLVNAAREIKSNLRASTGVLTDVIDYVMNKEGVKPIRGEDERIKRALKAKTPFWKDNTIDDVLDYMVEHKDASSRGTLMSLFASVVSMYMPNVRFILCLPFFYWALIKINLHVPDFGAQGFFKGYKRLADFIKDKGGVAVGGTDKLDQGIYAILLSMMDMHFADQALMPKIFEGIKPLTRPEMSNYDKKLNVKITLPSLIKWSKVYSGQRGTGGEEQEIVVQTMAGQVKYSGSDFITQEPEVAKQYNLIIGKQMIVQRLQDELRRQYDKLNGNDVTYGTQNWYSVSDLEKSNDELSKTKGVTFVSRSVIPYYSNKRKGDDTDAEPPRRGGLQKSKRGKMG